MRSRLRSFAIDDFFAMFLYSLFLASRALLALLAVRIFFVNHINASLPADNLVPLARVCFD